ncbi:hypothetical protein CsSME_00043574 [Camellia sinensis var. sinensis]
MTSWRCWYWRVSDADAVEFPSSSLATDPSYGVVRFPGTLLTPQPIPYVNAHYLPPYLPDVAHFSLLLPLSSAWFPVPRSKARMELVNQSSKLFVR